MEVQEAKEVENEIVECESSNRKKRSVAWDHFEKLPAQNKDEGKAKCKHCDMIFTSTPKSGTSHLKRHIERCPKRLVLDVKPIAVEGGLCDVEYENDGGIHGRKISRVWYEFEKFRCSELEEQKARCKHCNMILSAAAKNGTSHLKRHLDKCLRRDTVSPTSRDIRRLLPSNPTEKLVEGNTPIENNLLDQNELRRYISLCVIEGTHPFSLVEERGFRRLISKVCPQFKPFSQSVVRRELLSMYVKERDSVKEMFVKALGRVCLMTTFWKAKDTKNEYFCLIGQFIDHNWKLCRRVMCFRALVPPYDGSSIANDVMCLLSQWSIEHKVFSITVDNASYSEAMVSSLRRGLYMKNALLNGGSFSDTRCYASLIDLIAKNTLDLVDDVLDKVRDLVKNVNRSPLQRKKFFDLAEEKFQLRVRHRLCLDIPLRWNTTYRLLDHTLYYKAVFIHLRELDQNLINDDEWQKLCMVHKLLKTLYDVTCVISAANCPSANLYLKNVLTVHCRIQEIARGPHTFLTDAFKEMQAEFDIFWYQNNLILSSAAILDPRYKVKFVEYCYMKLYGTGNVAEHVNRAMNTLYCLFAEYKQHAVNVSAPDESSDVNTSFATVSDDVFGDYNQFLSVTSRSQGNKSELDLYLEEPSYDLNSDLDVLEFWSKSSTSYPVLSAMARDILSIPASTVTSKSAFNYGSKTLSSVQGSMMPESVEALICLQDWLYSEGESADSIVKHEDISCSSGDAGYDDKDDSVLTDSV